MDHYKSCTLCPRECGADRYSGTGWCRCPAAALVAKTMLHKWEEPALAGDGGSGSIFFGGCTLGCAYCQNQAISRTPVGTPMDGPALRREMEDLIGQGAENIDLVTPTQYIPTILEALSAPLPVPVVYNCGGYEKARTLKLLEGKVDIYLPDFKYADPALFPLSHAQDYCNMALETIAEMLRQVGPPQWEGDRLRKGVLVRHLILPGHVENSLKVLDLLGERFPKGSLLVSLMRQYTPMSALSAPLDRRVTQEEYEAVLSWMYLNGLQGFAQEAQAAETSYIPDF